MRRCSDSLIQLRLDGKSIGSFAAKILDLSKDLPELSKVPAAWSFARVRRGRWMTLNVLCSCQCGWRRILTRPAALRPRTIAPAARRWLKSKIVDRHAQRVGNILKKNCVVEAVDGHRHALRALHDKHVRGKSCCGKTEGMDIDVVLPS